jgi:hypothetical protein
MAAKRSRTHLPGAPRTPNASEKKTVKFKQITTGHFSGKDGSSSYSVLGVSTGGRVYRYDPQCEAWIPWSNKVATCKKNHKAGR